MKWFCVVEKFHDVHCHVYEIRSCLCLYFKGDPRFAPITSSECDIPGIDITREIDALRCFYAKYALYDN